jgi:hypothetical protein
VSGLTQTFTFARPAELDPAQLRDELARVPGCEPWADSLGNMQAGVHLTLDSAEVRVRVRDDVPEDAIYACLQAHVPAPPPPSVQEKVAQVLIGAPELSEETRAALVAALTG